MDKIRTIAANHTFGQQRDDEQEVPSDASDDSV